MQVSPIQTPPPFQKTGSEAAEKLEQAFLEEMMKYCGPKSVAGAFGGGAGEDQFGSFLTREYAAIMAAQVDLGFDDRMKLQ